MAQLNINLGTSPGGLDGDDARTAFGKVNSNFKELYTRAVPALPTTLNAAFALTLGGSTGSYSWTRLGTAAAANLQSSISDASPGKATQVGAFGWGLSNANLDVPGSDLNSLRTNGLWRAASTVTGTMHGANICQVLHAGQAADYAAQVSFITQGRIPSIKMRVLNDGTWSGAYDVAMLQGDQSWMGKQTFVGDQDFTSTHTLNAEANWSFGSYYQNNLYGLRIRYEINAGGSPQAVKLQGASGGRFNDAIIIDAIGRVQVPNFCRLGDTAPAIKMKKVTGTSPSAVNGSSYTAHGLTAVKIIGVQPFIVAGSTLFGPGTTTPTREYRVDVVGTNIVTTFGPGTSNTLFSQPMTFLITYEA